MKKILLIGAVLVASLPSMAAVRFVGGFGGYRGFGGYGPYYSGFYGGYYPAFQPNAGEVKLDTKVKNADVFINGAYAGTAGKLKSMWLRPGTYKLELRAAGTTQFAQSIFVVPGKTLHVNPDQQTPAKP